MGARAACGKAATATVAHPDAARGRPVETRGMFSSPTIYRSGSRTVEVLPGESHSAAWTYITRGGPGARELSVRGRSGGRPGAPPGAPRRRAGSRITRARCQPPPEARRAPQHHAAHTRWHSRRTTGRSRQPKKGVSHASSQAEALDGPLDGDGTGRRQHDRLGRLPSSGLTGRYRRPDLHAGLGLHRRRRDPAGARLRQPRPGASTHRRSVRLREAGVRRLRRLLDGVGLLDRGVGRQRGDRRRVRRLPRGVLAARSAPRTCSARSSASA